MTRELGQVVKDLQDFTRQRRVRWESLFKDFDRHNTKHVTVPAFHRGLKASQVDLNEQEVLALTDMFRSREGVNYEWFCDHINQVFTEKGLEKAPQRVPEQVLPLKTNLHYVSRRNELSPSEEAELGMVMSTISEKVRTESIILSRFFKDFDRHRTGFISKDQFRRSLRIMFGEKESRHDSFSDILIQAYEDLRGDVNYRRFTDDIAAMISAKEQACVASSLRNRGITKAFSADIPSEPFVDTKDIEATIQTMQHVVRTEGIQLLSFFVDLDRMKKGLVKRAQFMSAVSSAFGKRVFLTEDLLEQLADRYSSIARFHAESKTLEQDSIVRYNDFIDEIDSTNAALRDLHKYPGLIDTRVSESSSGDMSMATEQTFSEQNCPAVLEKIKLMIRMRRMHLKPVFRDFDRLHRGVVTPAQFQRVVKQELAKLMLSDDELQTLSDFFSKGHGKGVDYVAFVNHVEEAQKPSVLVKAGRTSLLGSPASSPRGASQRVDRERVVASVQRTMKALRIRLSEFLSDADRQRHGRITLSHLARGLSRARIQLTPEEVEALAAPYLEPHGMEASKDQINLRWRELVREMELVEVVTGLEKLPSHSGQMKSLPKRDWELDTSTEEGEEDRAAQEVLNRLSNHVRTNRVLLLPTFKVHDKLNSGKLEQPLFRRALDTLDLKPLRSVPESVYDKICEKFSKGRGSLGYIVDFREFCSFLDTQPNSPRTVGLVRLQSPGRSLSYRGGNQDSDDASLQAERVASIMAEITDQAWSKGLKVKGFFEDYDRLRKGKIPTSKFESALSLAGFVLKHGDAAVLSRHFRDSIDESMVCYMPFVHQVDGGDERLELAPTAAVAARKPRSVDEKFRCEVSEEEIEAILNPMRHVIKLRSLQLLDTFRNYDKKNRKTVTLSQFASVLKTNGVLPRTFVQEKLTALLRAFPSNHAEEINYSAFVKRLQDF